VKSPGRTTSTTRCGSWTIPIRASYVGILILITLLIVFARLLDGIYLARQITVPVQLLAEGTEEVARGNLDVRWTTGPATRFGTTRRLVQPDDGGP